MCSLCSCAIFNLLNLDCAESVRRGQDRVRPRPSRTVRHLGSADRGDRPINYNAANHPTFFLCRRNCEASLAVVSVVALRTHCFALPGLLAQRQRHSANVRSKLLGHSFLVTRCQQSAPSYSPTSQINRTRPSVSSASSSASTVTHTVTAVWALTRVPVTSLDISHVADINTLLLWILLRATPFPHPRVTAPCGPVACQPRA